MNATALAASTNNYTAAASQQASQVAVAASSGTSNPSSTGRPLEPMSSSLPVIKPEIFLNDHSLVAVYCFVKNFIGASGTSAVAIDNKIEQAMDLVKSHLMFAVREEVEVLKEKISELMDRINQLEYENNILKANASQETLSQLTTTGSGGGNGSSTAAAVVAAAVAASAASAPTPASKVPPPANPNSNGSVS